MNLVLTSKMYLNLQQPSAKLWRVQGLIRCVGNAAPSIGPHLCPDRLSEVIVRLGRWSYKYRY